MTSASEYAVIDAGEVAKNFRDYVKERIKSKAINVKLVGFLANKDPAAEKYAAWTAKSCSDVGITFELRKITRESLENSILEANEDKDVHGIMVYYPVFGGGHDQYIQNCLTPLKDVEGLCHLYRFNMYHNVRCLDKQQTLKSIIPCTPLALIKILEYAKVYDNERPYGNQLFGKTITIINRSEVVGRPLAALLANDGAKIFSIDLDGVLVFYKDYSTGKHRVIDSELSLDDILSMSDVVISGVPSDNYKINTNSLKEKVIAINFSSNKNFDESTINTKASMYCSSIGKVTITMLQRNLIRLREYQLTYPAFTMKEISF